MNTYDLGLYTTYVSVSVRVCLSAFVWRAAAFALHARICELENWKRCCRRRRCRVRLSAAARGQANQTFATFVGGCCHADTHTHANTRTHVAPSPFGLLFACETSATCLSLAPRSRFTHAKPSARKYEFAATDAAAASARDKRCIHTRARAQTSRNRKAHHAACSRSLVLLASSHAFGALQLC